MLFCQKNIDLSVFINLNFEINEIAITSFTITQHGFNIFIILLKIIPIPIHT